MEEKIQILYVDDEQDNLTGFKAAFRLSYQIYTAENAQAAIRLLEKHPDIRIIICDQRMPQMTGVEFFEQVRHPYPLPIRILITAYTDIESVIGAVNRGQIFRYIGKPWYDADIVSAIEEAHKFYVAIRNCSWLITSSINSPTASVMTCAVRFPAFSVRSNWHAILKMWKK